MAEFPKVFPKQVEKSYGQIYGFMMVVIEIKVWKPLCEAWGKMVSGLLQVELVILTQLGSLLDVFAVVVLDLVF